MKSNIFSQLVGYYSDRMYSIDSKRVQEKVTESRIKVAIFARKHYIEKTITFPISNKKDLRAAIELETDNLKEKFQVFYKIGAFIDGKTSVTLWQIPKDLINENLLIALPESYVLSTLITTNQLLVYKTEYGNDEGYVSVSRNGLTSAIAKGQSKEIFCHASNANITEEVLIEPSQFNTSLKKALKLSIQNILLGFWLKKQNQSKPVFHYIKPFLLPVITIFSIYLGIFSAYLSVSLTNAEELITSHKAEIDTVLNLQQEMSTLSSEIERYQLTGQNKQPLWKIWQIFSPLFEQGVKFKFIRFNGQYIFFRATSSSASSVLEYLHNSDDIGQAEFTSTVTKKANEESFTIRFSLLKEGKVNEA